VFGSTGLTAKASIERAGRAWSVSGVQWGLAAVALVVFQTPPLTEPTYTTFALAGSTAMA
jgi:hypothetical protein